LDEGSLSPSVGWRTHQVVASNLDTLQPVTLSDFTSEADLRTCLRASANVPVVAGPHVECRGARLVDAAVFEGVPIPSATSDGCSHVLCLCSASRCVSCGPLLLPFPLCVRNTHSARGTMQGGGGGGGRK
jgi:predicted acylesterase/phospholipase RssA